MTTRAKSISQYRELYCGPIYKIEHSYATIWIICVMAFVFGPMIPLMFPMALLALMVLYAVVRLRVAYSVQRMPIYDQKANRSLLLALRYLPVVYCFMSAYLYSN